MLRLSRLAPCVFLLFFSSTLPAQIVDVRERHFTRSLEAVLHIEKGLVLSDARKHVEALGKFEAALKADPRCPTAHYRRGIVLVDLGRVDEGVSEFLKVMETASEPPGRITVEAAIRAGQVLSKVGREQEALECFSRAVLADPADLVGLRDDAWRGMAATLQSQKRCLAAALALLNVGEGESASTPRTTDPEWRKLWHQGASDPSARLLSLPYELPKYAPRQPSEMDFVPVQGQSEVRGTFCQLLPDPKNACVVAVPEWARSYYVISTAKRPTIRKVDVPFNTFAGAVADGRLYLLSHKPPMLEIVDTLSGKIEQSIDLKGVAANSVAPFPSRGVAYVADGYTKKVHRIDLESGRLTDVNVSGWRVAADPKQRYLFVTASTVLGVVLVPVRAAWEDGVPIALVKYLDVGGQLMLAELRPKTARCTDALTVSPDGQWVIVLGWRGGWGTNVSVDLRCSGPFSVYDVGRVQSRAAPRGTTALVTLNPVTGQAAVIEPKRLRVFHLGGPPTDGAVDVKAAADEVLLEGDFAAPAAWSPDGRYLIVKKANGVGFYACSNRLSEAETQFAGQWWKGVAPQPAEMTPAAAEAGAEPVQELASFKTSALPQDIHAAFERAITSGRVLRPPSWPTSGIYALDDELVQLRDAIRAELWKEGQEGVLIYRMREALGKHPDAVWVKLHLGEALRRTGQAADARQAYEECVRADRGRSTLTPLALNELASTYVETRDELSALRCLALSLLSDRGNAATLQLAGALLKANGLEAEAGKLAALYPEASGVMTRLPPLGAATPDSRTLSADQVHEQAAPSVALLAWDRGVGTGFCVGVPGVLLTNDHVTGGRDELTVYPFRTEEGRLVRMPRLSAEVLCRWKDLDVAVVRVRAAPATMVPLDVAVRNPRAGEKVYAVGNPGLGTQILEQSISAGLISSAGRQIEGQDYLQHTAAVNPGNSGGPLLNERGQVVGMVTLKAGLEAVSFAIPVEEIRKLFRRP